MTSLTKVNYALQNGASSIYLSGLKSEQVGDLVKSLKIYGRQVHTLIFDFPEGSNVPKDLEKFAKNSSTLETLVINDNVFVKAVDKQYAPELKR